MVNKHFNNLTKIISVALLTLLLATMLTTQVSAGPIDTYAFNDEITELRFQKLNYELRCPKCQNQNLADSNSPIAQDLRKEVYDMLMDGRSDMEIMDFMVNRYGEYVLYRPRVNSMTYILWFSPIAFILIGGFVVFLFVRKRDVQPATLNKEQQQQLDSILKDD
ncbi:cytochrome c-type biogenesis protein CcmH [Colwelliaceae bacterium BS250]